MNETNRKRQHLQQLEGQDNDKDNHSIAGASSEWSFNSGTEDKNTTIGNGNELKEMKLKMAALESKIALLEAKNQTLEGKLANQQELAEENKTLVEKLKESEQKAQMVKNELEEISQTCRQKLEKLTSEIAKFKEQEQKAINFKPETTTKDSPCLRLLPLETWTEMFGFVPRFGSTAQFLGLLGVPPM